MTAALDVASGYTDRWTVATKDTHALLGSSLVGLEELGASANLGSRAVIARAVVIEKGDVLQMVHPKFQRALAI